MGAGASAIKAGEAFVRLSTDMDPLTAGLGQAAAKLRSWGKGIALVGGLVGAAGAAITAPFLEGLHVFTDYGAEMLGMSKRTGITVEDLTALGFAAEQSGVSTEELSHGLRHMQRDISQAGQGSAEAAGKFQQLGLSVQQLQGLSPDKQFEAIADAFAGMKDPAQKAGAAMGLFGRGGVALIPLLEKGAAGIEQLKKRAGELGLVMATTDAEAAADFKHELGALEKQSKMVAFQMGAAVMPMVRDWVKEVQPAIGAAINWAKENRGLLGEIFKLGAILTGVGTAIAIVGALATAAGYAFAFLLSPVGLVLIAVAALGIALYALGAFDALPGLIAEATAALAPFTDAIKNAINAGDLGAAWDVVMGMLRVGWYSLVADLVEAWIGFKTGLSIIGAEIAAGFGHVWENIKLGAQLAFLTVTRAGQAAKDAAVRDSLGRDQAIDAAADINKRTAIAAGENDPALLSANVELQGARNALEEARKKAASLKAPELGKAKPGGTPEGLNLIGESVTTFSGAAASRMGYATSNAGQQLDALNRIAENTDNLKGGPGIPVG